jgi:hypothetical protein
MLILLSFILPSVAGMVLVLTAHSLPSPLLDWLLQQPADRYPLIPQSLDRRVALLISGIAAIAVVVAIIGLFRFRRWARSAYVVITVLYFLGLYFARPCVLPAPAFCIFAISYMVQGAIITMAFSLPTSLLFAPNGLTRR